MVAQHSFSRQGVEAQMYRQEYENTIVFLLLLSRGPALSSSFKRDLLKRHQKVSRYQHLDGEDDLDISPSPRPAPRLPPRPAPELPPRPAPKLPPRPRPPPKLPSRLGRKRDSKQPEWIQILEDDLLDAEDKEKNEEPRKRIFHTDTERSVGQFMVFQFPAMAITIALFVLHGYRMEWPDINSNISSALLVGAKIHETLIVASLFQILYSNIRRKLVGSEGIPFGFLTAPFQLSSPFYLFSSSFLAPLTQFHDLTLSSVWMAFIMVASFSIATLAGASSGIVMLPKLGWWNMSPDRSVDPYAIGPLSSIYPKTMDRKSIPEYCPAANDTTSSDCAHAGYDNPNSIDWSWLSNIARGTHGLPTNLTSGGKSVAWWKSSMSLQTVVGATTPMKLAASQVAKGYSMDRSDFVQTRRTAKLTSSTGDSIPLEQPRIAIQCTDPSRPRKDPLKSETMADAPFNFLLDPGLYYRSDPTFFIPHELLDVAYNSKSHFGFIDLGRHAPVQASATFWTRYNTTGTSLALCFIDARWVGSSVWSYSNSDLPLFSHAITNATLNASKDLGDIITLTVPWLNSLNNSLDMSSDPLNYKTPNVSRFAYDRIYDYAVEGGGDQLYQVLSRSLAVYLVDALAELTWSRMRLDNREEDRNDGAILDYALVGADQDRLVYEYNFEGLSVKLAFGVLLLHVLLVVVHFVGTVCVYRKFGSSAWEQLGELMTLAMNSRGTELLKNTSVGVHKWEVWRLMARVTEDEGQERKVELRLSSNQRVGDEESSVKEVSGKRPTAFRKYG
ncbi:hypothetical protein QC764_506890 [Podospora pseudoanserina]|uniref:Uncharacterized protein n=1 Tax=Podospora pseudoanserina TaxID=2609844 RepID=A0ABR0I676_9PEZI|nr:hypothetical protein QC764_506890 [Podospora pseudoanserina]